MDDRAWLYVLEAAGLPDVVKIGSTCLADPTDRVRRGYSQNQWPCRIIVAFRVSSAGYKPEEERRLHERFRAERLHREWFNRSPAVQRFIDRSSRLPSAVVVRGGFLGWFGKVAPDGPVTSWPAPVAAEYARLIRSGWSLVDAERRAWASGVRADRHLARQECIQ